MTPSSKSYTLPPQSVTELIVRCMITLALSRPNSAPPTERHISQLRNYLVRHGGVGCGTSDTSLEWAWYNESGQSDSFSILFQLYRYEFLVPISLLQISIACSYPYFSHQFTSCCIIGLSSTALSYVLYELSVNLWEALPGIQNLTKAPTHIRKGRRHFNSLPNQVCTHGAGVFHWNVNFITTCKRSAREWIAVCREFYNHRGGTALLRESICARHYHLEIS